MQLKLSGVENNRSLYDFLNAISGIAPEFTNIWTINIQMKLDSDETLPDLYKIVELFRNNRRLSNAQKSHISHSAFPASFQGQSIDKNESEKKHPLYLYGEDHRYKDCPYLIKSARTKDWKLNPSIQRQIDEKLQKNPRLKKTVDHIWKQQQDNTLSTDQSTPSAFTVSTALTTSDYHLRDSFILDSEANSYVCNDREVSGYSTCFRWGVPIRREYSHFY
jgi:hypothetical protein